MTTKSNFLSFQAAPSQSDALAEFLSGGARLVAETEPGTDCWWALRSKSDARALAIFDLFHGVEGRAAHFGGKVAAALEQSAPNLVDGGWPAVLAGNHNLAVVAAHRPPISAEVREATAIVLDAAAGQERALEEFLCDGCKVVAQTEPKTLYWYALRSEDQPGRFLIVDFFFDESGRAAHFGGQVAAALKDRAEQLVAGGWEAGVLANVVHYDVVASAR
ncbi:MAG: putative quinol monooxygenase [Planctomycetota bacterium]